MRLFVTGGAGYIGSHFIKNLYEQSSLNPDVMIYDNLSTGNKSSILYGDLVVNDLENLEFLKKTLMDFKPEVVIHFAASIKVEESMRNPYQYYQNNTTNTLNLMECMKICQIPYFIFSSTGAVYASLEEQRMLKETDPLNANNVYGDSKAIIENILSTSAPYDLPFQYVVFRYFNVAGASVDSRIGQISKNMSHLIGRALEVAIGEREYLPIYGDDYNTPDGTCIRDYIHIEDLVNAHIKAISYLQNNKKSDVFNLGCGRGLSVKEIVQSVMKVTGKDIPVKIEPKRAGDVSFTVSDNNKALETLQWNPKYCDINEIVRDAWRFIASNHSDIKQSHIF